MLAEINGPPPTLAGAICTSVIFELYEFRGDRQPGFNIAYLRFGDRWHRLYFDCGIIFWRDQIHDPKPWAAPERGWNYPHVALDPSSGIVGKRLAKYTMGQTSGGSHVDFEFEGGRHLVIRDEADVSTYEII